MNCRIAISSFLPWIGHIVAVTITNNVPASTAGSNDASGTVQVHGTNVALYNLNIANTFGQGVRVLFLLQ